MLYLVEWRVCIITDKKDEFCDKFGLRQKLADTKNKDYILKYVGGEAKYS